MFFHAQDELVYLLKCSTDSDQNVVETSIPRQLLLHVIDVFEKSSSASMYRIMPMSHLLYDFDSAKLAGDILNAHTKSSSFKAVTNSVDHQLLFENKDNAGFLYFRPSQFHHVLHGLSEFLPEDSYLIGLLVHKWEIPWAKLFPLRLYLGLGEQFDRKRS